MVIKAFGRVITVRRASVTKMPAINDDSGWQSYLSGHGYLVDADTALRVAAVFRCVDIISKTMAALPLQLFFDGGNGKQKARDHPLYNLVSILPNRYTTAYSFWQMYVANLLLTVGAYAKIVRNGAGRIIALLNIPSACVSELHVSKINGERYIDVILDGLVERLYDGDFMYTPSFRFSSDKKPEDPMHIAASVLGLTGKANTYASQGFSTASPGGIIEYPSSMSDKAYERFKEEFTNNYAGVANAGKWIMLEEGGKAQPFDRDMEKSQVLESRKWAVTEICRLFGVPPHLCMDMEHATFSNIEQQSLEFVRDCINPASVQIEQTLFRDLLNERERRNYRFKFNTNAVLRGDTATRTTYYNTMRQNGVMNADEIRDLEDMNEIAGGEGKIYAINGNMIPLGAVPANLPKGAQNRRIDNV